MSVSASKSALLLSPCLRWAGPLGKEFRDEFASVTKRDKGILFHGGMDIYYAGGAKPSSELTAKAAVCDDAEVVGWVDKAVAWSIDHLEQRCKQIATEVYVASNFATGEVHTDPSVRDRGYPDKPGFTPGTADLVCILRDGSLLVGDWKTGGSAGADKQLLSLAYGLSKVYRTDAGGLRPVILAVLHAGPDGVLPNEWEVSESDLQAHADAMAFQLADVGVRNDAVIGSHCTQLYCPHLAYCPGVQHVVEELGRDGLACNTN